MSKVHCQKSKVKAQAERAKLEKERGHIAARIRQIETILARMAAGNALRPEVRQAKTA